MTARCTHWIGVDRRYCGRPDARRFVNTFVCPAHTPSALAGRPEPGTPTRPAASDSADQSANPQGAQRP